MTISPGIGLGITFDKVITGAVPYPLSTTTKMGLNFNFGGSDVPIAPKVATYETWLGRSVDFVQIHTGRANWSDYITSIGYMAGLYASVDKPRHWSIPMFITGGTLSAAASGSYDTYWQQAAEACLANSPGSGAIPLRTGWEMNGNWQPWASAGNEALFNAAWRRMHAIFMNVSSRFKFIWCVNFDTGTNPTLSYPGDGYVDIISMDVYVDQNNAGFASSPSSAWNYYKSGATYDMDWLVSFAAAHGKPVALDEWGVPFNGYESFMASMFTFLSTNNFIYNAYWESNSAYPGKLSDNQYPTTATGFIAQFGPVQITSTNTLTGGQGFAMTKVLAAARAVTWTIVTDTEALFTIQSSNQLRMSSAATIGDHTVTIRGTDTYFNIHTDQTLTFTAATAWTPTALSTALIDFYDISRTDMITKDGSNRVSQINSLVGSPGVRNLAQGSATNQPLFVNPGLDIGPIIRVDGNDAMTQSTITGIPNLQSAIGIFLSFRGDASLTTFKYAISIADAALNNIAIGSGSGGVVRLQSGGNLSQAATALPGNHRNVVVSIPAGTSPTCSLSVDGKTPATGAVAIPAATVTRFIVGAQAAASNGVGNYFLGDIAVVGIVNRELTSDEITRLHGWLYHHTGGTIEAGHTYQYVAPYV